MFDWIVDGLIWVFDWLLGVMSSLAQGIWDGFWNEAILFDGTSLEAYESWFVIGNQWIPIDVYLTGLGGFWTFSIAFAGAKFVLKLIPGIG